MISTVQLYRGLARVLRKIPEPVALDLATLVGWVASYVGQERFGVVRANLAHVLGETSPRSLDRATRAAFGSYGRYWADVAKLTNETDLESRFVLEDNGVLAGAFSGEPAILALPHLGSWEMGGLYTARRGHPLVTVAEELTPPELFEWFVAQREHLGITVLALRSETTAKLLASLRRGGIVALIADRDITGDGVEVNFFGAPTTVPGGAALLALRTGAPLYPTAIYHSRSGLHRAVVRPAIAVERRGSLRADLARITQALVNELEILITAAPEQWHVFQPNWPQDRGHQ